MNGNLVTAVGSIRHLSLEISPELKIEQEKNQIILTRKDEERKTRALHGLNRTLVSNIINGVNTGFSVKFRNSGSWL